MKRILCATTALTLALTGCKVSAPEPDKQVQSLLSSKVCRDLSGRFAKCQTCPDGSRIWIGATCPVPPPPPPVDPLTGEAPIASEFDPQTGLIAIPLPGSASPDVVGAFRFVCSAGQLLRDDPIVYPGQPGKSHLHQFYGNTGANAYSTYKSLRTSGQSTCSSLAPLNRSAYWQPAMLDGKGNVIQVEHIQIYYKRRPKSDPLCQGFENRGEGKCIALPNGLKFIFGYDMVTAKAPTGSFDFICSKSGMTNSPAFKTIPEGAAYAQCTAGGRFYFRGKAPGCWNGKDLDSANHRDHVAYAIRDPNYGFMHCPTTHPYVIPGFTILGAFDIAEGDDLRLWRFASDDMHPELPHGSTFHADFFMAWDPTVHMMWEANCIDKMLNCSSGDLGNGWQMRNVLKVVPRLVPIP